jgi:hypothetical protein
LRHGDEKRHWALAARYRWRKGVRFDLKVLKTAFHDAYV